jgi:D-alanyl-D-alanine carboxypeptidase
MHKKAGKASYGLRWGVFGLVTAFAVLSVSADPADARAKKKIKRGKPAPSASYQPPYADIVVDANNGAVLHATNPDSRRHPASLTKIMTLYMLFERLEAGNVTLRTEFPVSAHAAAQPPSKLRLKAGDSITVEDAIKALVTKSANDVAAVVAEGLSGDEDTFARMMTAKARSLGMEDTVYKNASGLPDPAMITTARDQAMLGRAIQDRFPKYYKYFSTTRFSFRGKSISGHNRLVGRVEGVDGIKTGYIHASGFNLVTSMRRDGRHVVAVVLGGRTASSRDAKMRGLITDKIRVASTKRTAPLVADATPPKPSALRRLASAVITSARAEVAPTAIIPLPRPSPVPLPKASPLAAPQSVPSPDDNTSVAAMPGSDDPLEPLIVRTVPVKPGSGIQQIALNAPQATASIDRVSSAKSQALAFADPTPPTAQAGVLGTLPVKMASALPTQPLPQPDALLRNAHRPGWVIQVGAFDREDDARARLSTAHSRAQSLLSEAEGFTERVVKGDKTLYRARFAGLEKEQAEAACQYLKKNDIACMALKN